jgi:uncharacterized 2Fe-2S/4Fe-4S cluster protein (DUF4445 family)
MAEELMVGTGTKGVLVLDARGAYCTSSGELTPADDGRVQGLAKAAARLFDSISAIEAAEESEHGEAESEKGAEHQTQQTTVTVQCGSLRIVKTDKLTLATA